MPRAPGARARRRADGAPGPTCVKARRAAPRGLLTGIAASPGARLGTARVLRFAAPSQAMKRLPRARVAAEVRRLRAAVKVAVAELRSAAQEAQLRRGSAEASILDAYLMLIEDAHLHQQIEAFIREERALAERATHAVVRSLAEQLASQPNSYLAERAHDLEFIADELVAALTQVAASAPLSGAAGGQAQHDGVSPVAHASNWSEQLVVADEVSPADLVRWAAAPPLGVITAQGGRDSHTAILARAMGLPAVVGVGAALAEVQDGEPLLIDGARGEVWRTPSRARASRVLASATRAPLRAAPEEAAPSLAVVTACGAPFELRVNLEGPVGLRAALEQGAHGVGLYRTELMSLGRASVPPEDEQYELYRELVLGAAPHPVTLRLFDFGADKPHPGAERRAAPRNPALGRRGVRLLLKEPELLGAQLRAMARASAHGAVRVLVPMVSQLSELESVARVWREVQAEVGSRAPLGVMIEVPGAAVLAERWCERADFLCLGTNDLAQYTLAADRTDPELAASALDPAVLRLIHGVSRAARHAERPLSVCGALASEPLGALLLGGLGVRELSVEAGQLLSVGSALRRLHLVAAEEVAAAALDQDDAAAVRRLLEARLGALIRERGAAGRRRGL